MMRTKMLALLLALVLVFSVSGAALATPGVDEPGVAGLFIDPIDNIILNPTQLTNMQLNGLEIPVTGYAQYLSATTGGHNPRLDQLYVRGYFYDVTANGGLGGWILDGTLINMATFSGGPLESTTIRTTLTGREFTDANIARTPWKIYKTGLYQVYASAHFTSGAEPNDTEGFTVSALVATITVYPMAAPNIAGIILEEAGVDPNQSYGKGKSKTFINLITETAHHMGPQTLFDGVEKSIIDNDIEVCNSDYWDAVLAYLNYLSGVHSLGYTFTYTLEDYIADLQSAP